MASAMPDGPLTKHWTYDPAVSRTDLWSDAVKVLAYCVAPNPLVLAGEPQIINTLLFVPGVVRVLRAGDDAVSETRHCVAFTALDPTMLTWVNISYTPVAGTRKPFDRIEEIARLLSAELNGIDAPLDTATFAAAVK